VKIAVIADTHLPRGARRLPDECLRRLAAAELILHGGDFVALDVFEELAQLAPVVGVLGNVDEPALAALLPERRVVEAEGARIGMVHDAGPRKERYRRLAAMFPDCAAVVYGHTHMPEVAREGDLLILNPGSPTERRRSRARSMVELGADQGALRAKIVTLWP
jgi:uncharacterized protein